MVPLPPYARRVEYLESTGTQWIDTELGYFPEFEIGAVVPDAVGNNTLGIDQSWKLGRHSAAEPVWRASLNNRSYATSVSCGTYADMSYHGTTFKCNSDTFTVAANQYVSGTMVLFSTGTALPSAYPLKLYYCRLFDQNGNLVRSFVPCRILDTGYLWDEVEGKFYGNQGTGSFVLGPDVREGVVPTRPNPFGIGRRREEIRRVEYLEATGTQWVDTGIKAQAWIRVDFSLKLLSTTKQQRLFGINEGGSNVFDLFINTNGNWTSRIFNSSGTSPSVSAAANTVYTGYVDQSTRKCVVNGTTGTVSSSSPSETTYTIPLFGRRNNGTVLYTDYPAKQQLYSLSISISGVLVRDFVPVRVGSVGYLLDRVSGRLFGSSGTGDFVVGPDFAPRLRVWGNGVNSSLFDISTPYPLAAGNPVTGTVNGDARSGILASDLYTVNDAGGDYVGEFIDMTPGGTDSPAMRWFDRVAGSPLVGYCEIVQ